MSVVQTLQVKVKPNARQSLLEEDPATGVWRAKVKAPPAEGQANQELIELIASRFGCAQSAVSIKSGASARLKLVRIHQSGSPE